MYVVFTGSSDLCNKSPIPAGVRRDVFVSLLHDHEFFLTCDPHYASHKVLSPAEDAPPSSSSSTAADVRKFYGLPEGLRICGEEEGEGGKGEKVDVVKLYDVVDIVPNPVWSSNVVSREEFVDTADGLWVRIRSPMGVVMETTWSVNVREGKGEELELVEQVKVSCSKLLLGIVKTQIEGNWKGIHGKIIERAARETEKRGGGEK
ncbi:hypothetical protein F4778DRAFT_776083 [Xylariomycetidae sp. FL2044]|nr:hypothetical protein F4778DRAFT_776083 [Xylariomycetidae sp. FL2044]